MGVSASIWTVGASFLEPTTRVSLKFEPSAKNFENLCQFRLRHLAPLVYFTSTLFLSCVTLAFGLCITRITYINHVLPQCLRTICPFMVKKVHPFSTRNTTVYFDNTSGNSRHSLCTVLSLLILKETLCHSVPQCQSSRNMGSLARLLQCDEDLFRPQEATFPDLPSRRIPIHNPRPRTACLRHSAVQNLNPSRSYQLPLVIQICFITSSQFQPSFRTQAVCALSTSI